MTTTLLRILSILLSLQLIAACGNMGQSNGSAVQFQPNSTGDGSGSGDDDDDDGSSGLGPLEAINKKFQGVTNSEFFGLRAVKVDDVNGDGINDIAVLSRQGLRVIDPTASDDDTEQATIWYLDKDVPNLQGSTLLCPVSNVDGIDMIRAGDLNNDGVDDIAIGDRSDDGIFSEGTVCIVSGINGSSVLLIGGEGVQDGFGGSLAALGDINSDGYDDIAVGALWEDERGSSAGAVYVVSGQDGSYINKIVGESVANYLGVSIAVTGDVNEDGHDDLLIGAEGYDGAQGLNSGALYIVSGQALATPKSSSIVVAADSSTLLKIDGGLVEDGNLGHAVDGGFDLNQDGTPDVIAGAPGNSLIAGTVYGFSGKTGTRLFMWSQSTDTDPSCSTNQALYGWDVAFVGDVDGNGLAEIAVGDPSYSVAGACATGKVYVNRFAGIDQQPQLLFDVLGYDQYDNVGKSVARAGDINSDGYEDVLLGKHSTLNNATGEVQIINQ